jgi:hypothetical protein
LKARRQRRQEEIQSLQEALEVLTGANADLNQFPGGGSMQEDAPALEDPEIDGPIDGPGGGDMKVLDFPVSTGSDIPKTAGGSMHEDAIVEADAPDVDGPEGYQYLLQEKAIRRKLFN